MPFPRPDGRISDGSDKVHLESVHPDVKIPIIPPDSGFEVDIPTGFTSTKNSTTTPLLAGATFTGEWEDITAYATITINGAADVPGTLYADFSQNATEFLDNYRQVQLSSGNSGIWGIHGLIKIGRYFRIRVINGSTNQTSIAVGTILHPTPTISVPTCRY